MTLIYASGSPSLYFYITRLTDIKVQHITVKKLVIYRIDDVDHIVMKSVEGVYLYLTKYYTRQNKKEKKNSLKSRTS